MKKTIIISAIALGFSFSTSSATTNIKTGQAAILTKANFEVSPFCLSIVKGDIETVKKLIELGANVNTQSNGMTPAMYAAKFNRAAILKLLVKHGAELKKRSEKGMTANDYAKKTNAKEVLTYLKNLS